MRNIEIFCQHFFEYGGYKNFFEGMETGEFTLKDETTGESFALTANFTERQKAILKAGGLLAYTKGE